MRTVLRTVMMSRTNRYPRQARATQARGNARRPPVGPSLRAPISAILLSLVIVLAPELTFAPTGTGVPPAAARPPIAAPAMPLTADIVPPRLAEPAVPRTILVPQAALPVSADGAKFQAALDAVRLKAEAFGVTFAAVRDGTVIWSGSSGVTRTKTPLAPADPMVVGSVAKTFVAGAILQLADEGEIDLDAPVRRYLPHLRKVSREITLRQLLDHTSGLADVWNDRTRRGLEEEPQRPWTSEEVLSTVGDPWYQPGQAWAYANTNYHLLGLVVERVTGSDLETEIQRRFLDPLGLAQTRSMAADDPSGMLPPAWATIFWAAGNMASNAPDLARWGDALLDGDVVSPATRRAMVKVHEDDYGLGVRRFELPGRTGYGHTGLLFTYTAIMVHLPDDDVTVALLVNRTGVDILSLLMERPPGGPSLLRLAISS